MRRRIPVSRPVPTTCTIFVVTANKTRYALRVNWLTSKSFEKPRKMSTLASGHYAGKLVRPYQTIIIYRATL